MKYKVAILCITYNHKNYIKQALDSFVMQKTNFPFVAIIGDDCSTDGTTEIIKEYAEKYPDIIKPIFHEQNTGGYQNFIDVANACEAEYVAWNEGDDYWTDEYKLQKQVDFLDSHKDYSICFHSVKVHFEDDPKKDYVFPKLEYKINRTSTIKNLLRKNYMQTNSVMYRWIFDKEKNPIINHYPAYSLPGDWYLHLLHAEKGKIYCMPQVMSVYRRHAGGIWMNNGQSDDFYLKYGYCILNFYRHVYNHFGYLSDRIGGECSKYLKALFNTKDFKGLETVVNEFPQFIEIALDNKQAEKKVKKYKKLFDIFLISNIVSAGIMLLLIAVVVVLALKLCV